MNKACDVTNWGTTIARNMMLRVIGHTPERFTSNVLE